MKKSYKKLIFFILIFSFLFFFNSFIFKFINQIMLNIILIIMLFICYLLFGFEKDRHRYTKDIILELIIVLMIFFLFYYLLGIVIGFAHNTNYYISTLFSLIVYILLKEYLRYQLLCKASESIYLKILIIIFFIIIDSTILFSIHSISFNKELFLLFAVDFLPLVSENILCSYLCMTTGYKPNVLYLLVIKLYRYIIPIVPNPSEYLYSIIFLLYPLIVYKHINNWFNKDRTKEVEIDKSNKWYEVISLLVVSIIVVILVYFVSGYFKYYAVAIASGSMEDVLSKGDVVIVDRKSNNYDIGDIIAYKYGGKIIVHRINKIIDSNDEYFVYTKGDANNNIDKYKITKDMIIGVVKFKIPFIGYPTVLINERW